MFPTERPLLSKKSPPVCSDAAKVMAQVVDAIEANLDRSALVLQRIEAKLARV
jgi:hypothetical protein